MNYINLNTNKLNIEILTTKKYKGVFNTPFESFNLSYNINDDPNMVLENRRYLCNELKVLLYNLIIPDQKGTDNVLKIDKITDNREGDAIYTYNKDLVLAVLHSDCSPIFVYCEDKEIICAIHSSVNGTLLCLVKKVMKTLINIEKVNPSKIHVYFGPGIFTNELIVDDKIKNRVVNQGYPESIIIKDNKNYFDINSMNLKMIKSLNVPTENIHLNNINTFTDSENFFCSRRNDEKGKMLSIIRFKEKN